MPNVSLEEALESKPNGKNLLNHLEKIKAETEQLLSKIIRTFPDFTAHDIRHSEKVIENLRFIIPDRLKEELNEHEIYFLIASAYLHDIGMIDFPELIKDEKFKEFMEKEQKRNSKIENEQIKRNYIRKYHHLRSEQFIMNCFTDLKIEDIHQARIIGNICRGHREENLHDMNLFNSKEVYSNTIINVPLLAAFLRIADELHITFERIPLISYKRVPPTDLISKQEWEKHLSISGWALDLDDPSRIICSAACKDQKIHRILKRLEDKINRELADLPNHLYQYNGYRRELPNCFLIDIKPTNYKPYDFRFSLGEKEITRLLMGEKLYGRKEESLRELLRNSVDACRFRKELLEKRRLNLNPEIVFQLTADRNSIIVTDNGIGMDKDIIERYFTKIGKSFYRSPDFFGKEVSFTPVSELGIGILSCFMIANKIVVDTKMDDSDPLLIEIDDVSDYFLTRGGERNDTGTTITLFLKEGIGEEIDLEKEIEYYSRHLEFPVRVILPSGEEKIIEDKGFRLDMKDLLSRYHDGITSSAEINSELEHFNEKYAFHLVEIDEECVKGIVALLFEKDKKLGLRPIDEWHGIRISKKEMKATSWKFPWRSLEKFFVSDEGIFIGNIKIMPRWLEEELVFADLNLKKRPLDLNSARNDIVVNEKFRKFTDYIERILINHLKDYLRMLEREVEKSSIYDSRKLFNDFFVIYVFGKYAKDIFESYAKKMKVEFKYDFSESFLNLLRKFYYTRCVSKNGITYVGYDRISHDKSIVILEGLENFDENHIKQIVSGCSGFKEDKLYLLPDFIENYDIKSTAEFLFKGINKTDFLEFFDMKESNELRDIIPWQWYWKVVKFKNYNSGRFIEFSHFNRTIFNRDNRFVDLLIRNKSSLNKNERIIIEDLFFRLERYLFGSSHWSAGMKGDFQNVLMKQKEILRLFADDGLINEGEIDYYMLTKNDFPPHLSRNR
jgi:signal transduction histidine kinase